MIRTDKFFPKLKVVGNFATYGSGSKMVPVVRWYPPWSYPASRDCRGQGQGGPHGTAQATVQPVYPCTTLAGRRYSMCSDRSVLNGEECYIWRTVLCQRKVQGGIGSSTKKHCTVTSGYKYSTGRITPMRKESTSWTKMFPERPYLGHGRLLYK
jgi:hypothetical protein